MAVNLGISERAPFVKFAPDGAFVTEGSGSGRLKLVSGAAFTFIHEEPFDQYWQASMAAPRHYSLSAAKDAGLNPLTDRHDLFAVAVFVPGSDEAVLATLDMKGLFRRDISRQIDPLDAGMGIFAEKKGNGRKTEYRFTLVGLPEAFSLTELEQLWSASGYDVP